MGQTGPGGPSTVGGSSSSVATDDPEIESDDEIEFLRPVLIDDYNEKNNNGNKNHGDGGKPEIGCQFNEDGSVRNTWECGPAAYWYNFYDLENLILEEKQKLAEKQQKLEKSKLRKVKKYKI